MLEATLAIALTALAGSAILLGINTSLDATSESVQQTIAAGMAQQLVDEVLGTMYAQPGAGAHQVGFVPNSYEMAGTGRERFNDIDDYHGVSTQPPKDLYGNALGADNGQSGTRLASFQAPASYFSRWRQLVEVYYVNSANFSQRLSGSSTSDYRCVDVKIQYDDPERGWLTLAHERRVVTYLQVP
jgi:hypothetical protein